MIGILILKVTGKGFPNQSKCQSYLLKSFSVRDKNIFPRNKVTVVLKLGLLASHMATALIENLWKSSECDVMFVKQRHKISTWPYLTCVMRSILFLLIV